MSSSSNGQRASRKKLSSHWPSGNRATTAGNRDGGNQHGLDEKTASREAQAQQGKPDETALLDFVICDVHRLEQRCDTVASAPEGYEQPDYEADN
ncbi:hypothetical protein SFGR64A_19410 (plasmid) [Sinorhizobium fredii GR64]|nr:hypothetical protein SFGR64A_19410 [Sinorhizobium fredii GR64]